MNLLLTLDAFCIGLFMGAWIVKRDVVRIAKAETIKALKRYRYDI